MIEAGDTIRIHYELAIESGTPLESTFDDEPEEFRYANGEMPSFLERRVAGMRVGDVCDFTIAAAEAAFGHYNPDNRHTVARDSFDGVNCEPGALVEFELPNGERVSGRVHSVDGDEVLVDFNHPLAGRDVHCRIQLVAVIRNKEES